MVILFILTSVNSATVEKIGVRTGLLGSLARLGSQVHRAAKIGAGVLVAKPLALGILGKCKVWCVVAIFVQLSLFSDALYKTLTARSSIPSIKSFWKRWVLCWTSWKCAPVNGLQNI